MNPPIGRRPRLHLVTCLPFSFAGLIPAMAAWMCLSSFSVVLAQSADTKEKPEQRESANSNASQDSKGEDESEEGKLPVREIHFVIAKNAIIHVDGATKKIVDPEEMGQLIRQAAKDAIVHPSFHSTREGIQREAEIKSVRWTIYKELWDRKRIRGMSIGSLSPRSYGRWDGVRNAEDLIPDPQRLKSGRVIDADGKPVPDAEVFLLPRKHINGVYLKEGYNRSPLDEHLARTDDNGTFQIDPTDDEHWIVATHVSGFVATAINELKDPWQLQLQPWAVLIGNAYGPRTAEEAEAANSPELADNPVAITSNANIDFNFYIYETDVAQDGSFVQPNVPPGNVGISRSFKTGKSSSMSFSENARTLKPGDVATIGFSPVTEGMKAQLKQATEQNKARERQRQ